MAMLDQVPSGHLAAGEVVAVDVWQAVAGRACEEGHRGKICRRNACGQGIVRIAKEQNAVGSPVHQSGRLACRLGERAGVQNDVQVLAYAFLANAMHQLVDERRAGIEEMGVLENNRDDIGSVAYQTSRDGIGSVRQFPGNCKHPVAGCDADSRLRRAAIEDVADRYLADAGRVGYVFDR